MPKKATSKNNLQISNPTLAKEWHPTKNSDLTPWNVTPNSGSKVWWLCHKGHEWEASIANRNYGGGCPYCLNKKLNNENNFESVNPELAKEWHPTKNNNLTPRDVFPSSPKKVWWLCKRGHEWEATVNNRNKINGRGCPFCHSQTSQLELMVFAEMKYIFGEVEHRKKIYGVECDVYIPTHQIGIEVDGVYYHKNMHEKDKEKTKKLSENGIHLIRLREEGLKKISNTDIFFKTGKIDFSLFKNIADNILNIIDVDEKIKNQLYKYIKQGKIANNKEYKALLFMLPSPFPELSLEFLNANLSKEWHPTKNGNITPRDVSAGSARKVWWLCNKGHEWEANIYNRSKGKGCPYCCNVKVNDENCLKTTNPALAKEWHPTKNGELTPWNVTAGSERKVWWLCSKGHEWVTMVNERKKSKGCPVCRSLAVRYPALVKEWHPTRNGNLTPLDVAVGSERKVWWLCSKGHEWKTRLNDRKKSRGCPFCANDENCLKAKNPLLAKEWHPTKNGELTPSMIAAGSDRKVWWMCPQGHEWEARIASRNSGSNCPYCCNKKVNDENCLKAKNPLLAKEWHPTKNGDLTPTKVTVGTLKKVWWQCSKGHEWLATVNSRNNGKGCPDCYSKRRKHQE